MNSTNNNGESNIIFQIETYLMKNNWKEEFDKEFQTTKNLQLDMNVYHVKTHKIQSHRQDIKDFIESLLEEQKKELSNRRMYQQGYDEAKKEVTNEIKKDLLDITKGIDDDGNEYIACKIDYFDIEDLFKRYD